MSGVPSCRVTLGSCDRVMSSEMLVKVISAREMGSQSLVSRSKPSRVRDFAIVCAFEEGKL